MLVPLDGSVRSEHALAYAAALSQANSHVTLLHVDAPGAMNAGVLEAVVAAQSGDLPVDDQEQATSLTAAAERWKPAIAGDVATRVVFGDPKTEILRVAEEIGADLIVTATHGRGAIGRWAFGSVADDVARSASIPTLVVRAEDTEIAPGAAKLTRIIFPYDGSALADSAQPLAVALANAHHLPVHVVCAYDPGPIGTMSSTGMGVAYPMEAYARMQDELEDLASESAAKAETAFAAAGVTLTTAVTIGPPAMVIEDAVKDGDMIIMTSRGHGGFERAIMGSVAEKLMRDGRAPTILVPIAPVNAPAAG